MNLRRFLAEAGTLVGLAVACALVSNALAGKERKLALPGDYPNATTFVSRAEPPPPAPRASGPGGPEVRAGVPPAGAEAGSAPPRGAGRAEPQSQPGASAPPGPTASLSPGARNGPAPGTDLLSRFPVHGQPFVEIAGEDAAWLHAWGALFLDARRTKDYAQGHVAGARSFPVWESEVVRERVEALVGEGRDVRQPVVLYCSGGDCEDSHMLAQTLFGAGFENLLVYRDGFPDWVRRGGAAGAGVRE